MSDFSTLTKLNAAELGLFEHQHERLDNAVGAVAACIELLELFINDDDMGDKIPEYVKTNFIRSGLMRAIRIANHEAGDVADLLEREIKTAQMINGGNHAD